MERDRGCYLQEDIGSSKDGFEVFHRLCAEVNIVQCRVL